VIEQRFERFERLPYGTSRSVLDRRSHIGAKARSQAIPRGPAVAPPPARAGTRP
jgi:hypothetical protein